MISLSLLVMPVVCYELPPAKTSNLQTISLAVHINLHWIMESQVLPTG